MDDLLQRMLDADRQGDEAVSAAESKAAALREEGAARIAHLREQCAAASAEECRKIMADAKAECDSAREQALGQAMAELERRKADFAAAIRDCRESLEEAILGTPKA